MAESWLKAFNGVEGIFQKFTDSYATSERRKELKAKLLAVFPKVPRPGVCFAKFQQAPSNPLTRGNLHPSTSRS